MARDSKKNAAYDSGIRGSERAPKATADAPRRKNKEDTLPNGATRMEILPADNGFIINCTWPRKDEKDYFYSPPKPKVFTSAEDVAEFIGSALKVKDEEEEK